MFLVFAVSILFYSSSVHAEGVIPEFRDGFIFKTENNDVSTRIRFRIQNLVSYETESLSDFSASEIRGNIRRLRLRLDGHVLDPAWRYRIQFSFSRNDMDWDDSSFPNVIRDAAIIYSPSPYVEFLFGQTKLPGNRQRVVSSSEMQMIDRSIVNRTFNIDRDFGFQAHYQTRPSTEQDASVLRIRSAVSTGDGRNTAGGSSGLAYTGRVEWLPFGFFKNGGDYFEGDLESEVTPKLSIGFGYSQNQRAQKTAGQIGRSISPDSRDMGIGFIDAVFKHKGLSLYLEWMNRNVDEPVVTNSSGTQRIFEGYGYLIQSGYFVSERGEWVGRFSGIQPSSAISAVTAGTEQTTLGYNHYLKGHRFKIQGDATYERQFSRRDSRTSREDLLFRFQIEMGI